jgi:hypothetical protein
VPSPDLATDSGLKDACDEIARAKGRDQGLQGWLARLGSFLSEVEGATETDRAALEFQRRLWDESEVSATGQGNVPVDAALENDEFRRWLAKRSMEPLPIDPRGLERLYEEIVEHLKPFLKAKVPHLKIYRVLAALFPDKMTTVADRAKLRQLTSAMGLRGSATIPMRHVWVRDRLSEVLGPVGADWQQRAERMALAWELFARFVRPPEEERTEEPAGQPGEMRLVPLPAARRRRGLTTIRGLFPAVLSALEFVRDGTTRQELIDFLRANAPDVKEATLRVSVNVLKSELGLIRSEGDRIMLSERGEAVLESGDPDDLADWLLTHVLGVDKALLELRDRGPLALTELVQAVKSMNPGWTTDFAPSSIVQWLRSFGVVHVRPDGRHELSAEGRTWATRIHWIVEALPPEEELAELQGGTDSSGLQVPTVATIFESIESAGRHFDRALVAELHSGLWSHSRRHFAILAGLSGSGKTLLGRSYGKAIALGDPHRLFTLTVQPGWYDPSPVLGFVNPLRRDAYESTAFIQFLLAAVGDPNRPYTVVLDEMNLSHPEQYLAPLLSAMETDAAIELHSEGPFLDGIPARVPYPANLAIIGTVNMDETTHGLSDKVLDRAFTLEFWKIDLDQYPGWTGRALTQAQVNLTRSVLSDLLVALAPVRLHFGWRTVSDVLDFLAHVESAGAAIPFAQALDAAMYAKVLPKLRGEDSQRFREALAACEATLEKHGLVRARAKVAELRDDLISTGSARFWR